MYDASNSRHVAKAEKAARSNAIQAESFIRVAMASIEGRAWFLGLLERCSIFHTPFTANANATAFNCGIQSIGLGILADIMAQAPDAYILMMRERNDRSASASDNRHRRGEQDNRRPDNDTASNGSGGDLVESDYDPTIRDNADDGYSVR